MKDLKEKGYVHTETCRNCGRRNTVTIEKGTTIKHALQFVACKNCGCTLK